MSVKAASERIVAECGRLDVVIHNAGHMSFGPAEAFTADADAASVARAVVDVVDAPFGKRPFRVHIDPSEDGAEIVNAVAGRVRAELLRRIGLQDLLHPRTA